jgi:hypothetical protein
MLSKAAGGLVAGGLVASYTFNIFTSTTKKKKKAAAFIYCQSNNKPRLN